MESLKWEDVPKGQPYPDLCHPRPLWSSGNLWDTCWFPTVIHTKACPGNVIIRNLVFEKTHTKTENDMEK